MILLLNKNQARNKTFRADFRFLRSVFTAAIFILSALAVTIIVSGIIQNEALLLDLSLLRNGMESSLQ